MESIDVIDLGDTMTLRQLAVGDEALPTPFISEFSATLNEDSDIEDEEPDNIPVRRGQPIFRQPLGVYDDNDGGSIMAPNRQLRSEGTTAPQNPPFTGKSGLLVEMDDTPTPHLDYLKLMVSDDMVDTLVTETNRYVQQTLHNKELSPKSRFHR